MKVPVGISKFIGGRHIWLIALLGSIAVFTYVVEKVVFGTILEEDEWHPVFMAIRNFMFLGVVAHNALRFGFKGGLATGVVIGLIEVPHVVAEMDAGEHRIQNLIEFAIFGPVGILISWLLGAHKRDEEALRIQAGLLDLELDPVYILDFDRNILYVNKAVCATHGYTEKELLSMKLSELDDPESAKLIPSRFQEIMEKGSAIYNLNHRHKNGSLIPLEVHVSVVELRGKKVIMNVARDITERQKAQKQLIAQDRLASIGQLVSGVAHEINNPMTSVIGFSELLLQRDLPDDIRADLKIVNDEAKRASGIVQNLMTFARKQPEVKAPVDLNEQIQRVLGLRSHEQTVRNIRVIGRYAPDLPRIMGNASQLQQVFFNIIVNAEQAMLDAHSKGTLTVTTERVGDVIKARFTDDGPGISPENMNRLFTPFFTTKEMGKGTGLGLSICHGIVTEHGGRIYAKSEFGKGATFVVELPLRKAITTEQLPG